MDVDTGDDDLALDDSGYAELFGPEPTIPVDDTELLEALGEYPDFLFHLARNRHGRVYLRVLRTLLLDKGKAIIVKSSLSLLYDKMTATRTYGGKRVDMRIRMYTYVAIVYFTQSIFLCSLLC